MSEAEWAKVRQRAEEIDALCCFKPMGVAERTCTPDEAHIYLDGYNAALRSQEQNEPLTCAGCKLNGLPHHPALRLSRCSRCSRENGRTDNYEPTHAPEKGEPNE